MTVYVIVHFITMLYYMVTCAHADDAVNTWASAVICGVIASVFAVFWPATMARWIYLDARARHGWG